MKTSSSILAKISFVAFLFLTFSCTLDKTDEVDPIVEAQYQIKIVSLKLKDSNDIGSGVNVYGTINGRFMDGGKWMESKGEATWSKKSGSAISFKGTHSINESKSSVTAVLKNPDFDNDYILLYGKLWDKDTAFGNDYMGEKETKVFLSQVAVGKSVTKTLDFNEYSSLNVQVSYKVTRLK